MCNFIRQETKIFRNCKKDLVNLQEVAAMRGEPDVWWVIRLLLLIIDGFKESSLWYVLEIILIRKINFR